MKKKKIERTIAKEIQKIFNANYTRDEEKQKLTNLILFYIAK